MQANLANEKFYLRLIRKGLLKVTKEGKAFNLRTGKEIGKSKGNGYRKLSWQHSKSKKTIQIQLHRLIWAYFKGVPKDPELEINHRDGNKQNCTLSNLELITSQSNTVHAILVLGRNEPKGKERPNAKFEDEDVRKCRKLFALGKVTRRQIKRRFGCSYSVVNTMLTGRFYSHVSTKWDEMCRLKIRDCSLKVKRRAHNPRSVRFDSYRSHQT